MPAQRAGVHVQAGAAKAAVANAGGRASRNQSTFAAQQYGKGDRMSGSTVLSEAERTHRAELLEWAQRETDRRSREENPDAPAQLRPVDDFSDDYANPTRYKTGDRQRVGRQSATLDGLIISECCGWPKRPTSDEVYEALRAESPTNRQKSMINMVLRADFETLVGGVGGWMEGAFTWRQIARAMERRTWQDPEQIRAINTTASS